MQKKERKIRVLSHQILFIPINASSRLVMQMTNFIRQRYPGASIKNTKDVHVVEKLEDIL